MTDVVLSLLVSQPDVAFILKRKRQEPQHRGRADFSILGEADVICRLQFIPNGINLRWI